MPKSSFLITLNPNVFDDNKKNKKIVRDSTNMILQNIQAFIQYKDKTKSGSRYLDDIIIHKSVLEVSTKNKKVHSHSVIEINHRTKIALRRDKLARVFRDLCGLDTEIHLDIQYVYPNTLDRVIRYLGKGNNKKTTQED